MIKMKQKKLRGIWMKIKKKELDHVNKNKKDLLQQKVKKP